MEGRATIAAADGPVAGRLESDAEEAGPLMHKNIALVLGSWLMAGALASPACGATPETADSIDPALALRYFGEAEQACERDGGALWGRSLCGPLLLVDPVSRDLIASQADGENRLVGDGALFRGRLPETEGVANTATDWAGVRWTMLLWPLPEDRPARLELTLHEMWHRIQDSLGLPMSLPDNPHLDTPQGRLWLRLEWRALRAALTTAEAERRSAVRDALLFRARRRAEFAAAGAAERALEMNEGLAAYTGLKLARGDDAARQAVSRIDRYDGEASLVRSFAYASGPAYGVLLDESRPDWRREVSPAGDLGEMLAAALGIDLPADPFLESQAAAERHGGGEVRRQEAERDALRRERLAVLRARLIDGPVLSLSLREFGMEFDPGDLQPLDGIGTVYRKIRIVDVWGILTVSGGALLHTDFDRIDVPAPNDPAARPLRGDGWELELQPGWSMESGSRPGDYVLVPDREID